ncbi:MAG: endonuclease III [Deltaproteobacteria bacterium]|nr:endonuclease III [Deltaproteobacteria bacterium]
MPEPRCELYHHTPFQLLVSVVLSAQTTDRMVNRCMEPVYRSQPDFGPEHILTLGRDRVLNLIRSVGLAPTKAENLCLLSSMILDQYQGRVPDTREALESLPGVGRKTANVILAEVYHQPTLAVDTHVCRVGRRLGLHRESAPLKAEKALLSVIAGSWLPAAHHWLILHGRYTCTARQPRCHDCSLSDLCPSAGQAGSRIS